MTQENAIRLSPSGPFNVNVLQRGARFSVAPSPVVLPDGGTTTITIGAAAEVSWLQASAAITFVAAGVAGVLDVFWQVNGLDLPGASILSQSFGIGDVVSIAYPIQFAVPAGGVVTATIRTSKSGSLASGRISGQFTTP